MTFKIYRASYKRPDEDIDIASKNDGYPLVYFKKDSDTWYVDIDTLDDLMQLSDMYDEDIVIRRAGVSVRDPWEIWIYDDYME